LFLTIIWSVFTPLSRIYVGVHSLFDVVFGYILGIIILITTILTDDLLQKYILSLDWNGILFKLMPVLILMVAIYPKPKEKWVKHKIKKGEFVRRHSDIFWSIPGSKKINKKKFVMGIHYLKQINILEYVNENALNHPHYVIYRMVLGLIPIIILRYIVKWTMIYILVKVTPKSDIEPKKRYIIDIPTKFITFWTICIFIFFFNKIGNFFN
jgi:hypothetical protein